MILVCAEHPRIGDGFPAHGFAPTPRYAFHFALSPVKFSFLHKSGLGCWGDEIGTEYALKLTQDVVYCSLGMKMSGRSGLTIRSAFPLYACAKEGDSYEEQSL